MFAETRQQLVERLVALYSGDRPESAGNYVRTLVQLGVLTANEAREALVDALIAAARLKQHESSDGPPRS
jgi:polyhydroxyalkanoate synthesis regulator phasin